MIKASELRIGESLVKSGNGIYRIIGATVMGNFIIQKHDDENFIDHVGKETILEGIELTEDWLVRFGFECHKVKDKADYYRLGGFVIRVLLLFDRTVFYNNIGGVKVEYKYVHQLQNAFALTGQELTVK